MEDVTFLDLGVLTC